MHLGGKYVVNVVKDFAGFVLMVVGTLVNGAVELSKDMYKAISKGVAAGIEVIGEVADAAVDKVGEVAGKAVTSVGNCCTFGVFDSTKNFGSCCGGPNLGSTIPGYLFDYAIKYSFDLALHEDDRYDWMRDVAENGPHEYSSVCLAPGTPLGGTGGEPCDTGSCPCKSGQICETKTLGGDYFCRDIPGGTMDPEGHVLLTVPHYTLNATGDMTRFHQNHDDLGPANWDAGTNCGLSGGGIIALDMYTRLKEDYALALFGDPERPSKRPLKDYERGGELEWVAEINQVKSPVPHQRNRYSSVCTGSQSGEGCSNPLFGSALYCKKDELCEYGKFTKNACRSVPAFARKAGAGSQWSKHYPDGVGFK
jgi:hypothetical protein